MTLATDLRLTAAAAIATITGALALTPLYDSFAWFVPAVTMVIVIGLTGLFARAVRVPAPLHPVLGLFSLLTLLTILYVRDVSFLGFLSGPVAIEALRELTQQGITESQQLVVPVPPEAGLALLAVGGVGVIALLVDFLAVTLRLPATAGLPIVALFIVPVAITRGDQPLWILPVAVSGWLLLLVVDARSAVDSWGPAMHATRSASRRAGPDAHPRAARARGGGGISAIVIGVIAVMIAMVLPGVVPYVDRALLPGVGGGGSGSGPGSGPTSVDPFVSVRRNLVDNPNVDLLTYQSSNGESTYLRLLTLENFDGEVWSESSGPLRIPSAFDMPKPLYPSALDKQPITYRINVAELEGENLPVPPVPAKVIGVPDPLDSGWEWDQITATLKGEGLNSRGLSYDVIAYDASPTRAELRGAPQDRERQDLLVALPDEITPQLGLLADQITATATSRYEQAVALERWFTREGNFTYSTAVSSSPDEDPIEAFLNERIGYCEQFASTMALMARSLGIPARVNIGFVGGRQRDDGSWQVRGRDVHAWPELWFSGIGWVRFEPTPGGVTGADVQTPSYSGTSQDQPQAQEEERFDQEALDNIRGNVPREEETTTSLTDVDTPRSSLLTSLFILALIAGIAALLWIVPGVVSFVRRYRRTSARTASTRIEGTWQEIGDAVRDLGGTWNAAATPRQAVEQVIRDVRWEPAAQAALNRLVWWLELVRYTRPDGDIVAPTPAELRADIQSVRRALIARADRRTRIAAWWAPLLPRSGHVDPSDRARTLISQ